MSNANLLSLESPADAQQAEGDFRAPARDQTNILARRERTALDGLCRQLPDWVTPDQLTAVGSAGSAVAALGYIGANLAPEFLLLASIGIAINWFGDSLDGSLARYREITRPRYGFYFDHSVDALNNLIFALGLGLSPYVSMEAALFLLCSYYLLSIHVFLSTHVDHKLKLTYVYFGPTELRLLAIAFNIVIYFAGPVDVEFFGSSLSLYSILVGAEGAAFVLVFAAEVFLTAQRLRREDAKGATASVKASD